MKARLAVTAGIGALMLFCLLTGAELFPFAPYTMYSNRYSPQNLDMLSVAFLAGDGTEIEATNEVVRPFDEARLKHAIMSEYYSSGGDGLGRPRIASMVAEALRIARGNTGRPLSGARLRLSAYRDLRSLRAGEPFVKAEWVYDGKD